MYHILTCANGEGSGEQSEVDMLPDSTPFSEVCARADALMDKSGKPVDVEYLRDTTVDAPSTSMEMVSAINDDGVTRVCYRTARAPSGGA